MERRLPRRDAGRVHRLGRRRTVRPLDDLAAAAWTFMPLAPPRQLREAGFDPLPDLPARLRSFLDAYSLTVPNLILPALRGCVLHDPEPLRWLQGIWPDLARGL